MDNYDLMSDGATSHIPGSGDMGVCEVRTGFDTNGDFVIQSGNMEQGHDTFVGGKHLTHTAANALGGENIYHGSGLATQTVPNLAGGVDVYDGNMQPEGSFFADGMGGETYLSFAGNGDEIVSYTDPLTHAGEFRPKAFDVNGFKD